MVPPMRRAGGHNSGDSAPLQYPVYYNRISGRYQEASGARPSRALFRGRNAAVCRAQAEAFLQPESGTGKTDRNPGIQGSPPECPKTQVLITAHTIYCACIVFGSLYIVAPAERGPQYTQFSEALPRSGGPCIPVPSSSVLLCMGENSGTPGNFAAEIFSWGLAFLLSYHYTVLDTGGQRCASHSCRLTSPSGGEGRCEFWYSIK